MPGIILDAGDTAEKEKGKAMKMISHGVYILMETVYKQAKQK